MFPENDEQLRIKKDEDFCKEIKFKITVCILCLLCLWFISLIVGLISFYFRESNEYKGMLLNVQDYSSSSGLGEFGGDTGS